MDRVQSRSGIILGAAFALLSSACAAYQFGNPFLPSARILVTVNPQVVESKIDYDLQTKLFVYETKNADFTLSPYPNDTTPAVLFTDYEVSYRNQDGAEISSFTIPRRRLAATVFVNRSATVPGGGTGTGAGGATGGGTGGGAGGGAGGTTGGALGPSICTVPVVPESVIKYGIDNGFVTSGGGIKQSSENWSSNLTGIVTFYGRDENQYPIKAEGTFTINFRTGFVNAGNN